MSKRQPGKPRRLEGFLKAKSLETFWPGCEVRGVDADGASRAIWVVRERKGV